MIDAARFSLDCSMRKAIVGKSGPDVHNGAAMMAAVDPIDERLPPVRLFVLAIQHLLTMYAGAVTVPLIIGAALHLSTVDTAYLVSSDLLACGLVTIIQCIGVGSVGVRLPVMMGVTFVALGPGVSIASSPSLGLPGVFGATMVSGLAGLLIAPVFSKLSRLFAPVVTGTTMVLIGLSLVNVAVTWAAGGSTAGAGTLNGMAIAGLVVAIILGVIRFARGFLVNTAVLIGIVSGFIVTCIAGQVDFSHVASAGWLMIVSPFHFGLPKFDLLAAVTMTVVMLVTMVETSGMLFVLSRIVERPLTPESLARGLRADAVGAIVGGLFNSLPYTSYSQNVAIVGMTGVRSRFVCATTGLLLIGLAALPKLSFLVTAIPFPVLGGAALIMFGMVAANGIHTLAQIDFSGGKRNLYVVALGLSVGLIPTVDPKFFDAFPPEVAGFLRNGVLLGVITSVLLNLLLNRGALADPAADPIREGGAAAA
jgi:NCS2 family nucleobase:cation symporter-2